MNRIEASERCGVPAEKIELYESWGLLPVSLREDGSPDYKSEELWQISAIHTLSEAGFGREELKSFPDGSMSVDERILGLKKYRCQLLCSIHLKQQSLDCLDYIILKLKNGDV